MSEMNREKGAEEGTTTCPSCGRALALEAQPDGSVAAEACPDCYPAQSDDAEGADQHQAPPPPPQDPPPSTPVGGPSEPVIGSDPEENQ